MNSLYNHGLKQSLLISKDLSEFEKNVSTSPLSLQGSITTSLNAFKKTINDYGNLVKQNPESDNTKHNSRLVKFKEELDGYSNKFESLKRQRENLLQEANKQELIGRRPNQPSTSENPYDAPLPQSQYLERLEVLYKEKSALARGSQQLDQILEMGQQAFDDIVEQNVTLNRLRNKFEESLSTLGVSQGTIRAIEKRARQDKWLFWGAFFFTIFCFWYILRRFH